MKLENRCLVPANIQRTWDLLMDIPRVAACVPGMEEVVREEDGSYRASMRVRVGQSRKMTARLQAATGGANPILLRTSTDSGHGGDTALSERIEQTVDVDSFLFHFLGVDYQPQ